MTLPRSSRRSTLSWAVNAVTMAALVSAFWLSGHQRPVLQPEFGTTPVQKSPGFGAAGERPAFGVAPAVDTDKQRKTSGANVATVRSSFSANARGLDAESVYPVAFRAAVKP